MKVVLRIFPTKKYGKRASGLDEREDDADMDDDDDEENGGSIDDPSQVTTTRTTAFWVFVQSF